MVLKLNGKPLVLNPASPTLEALKRFLDKSSAEDLFDFWQLKEKTGVGRTFLKNTAAADPQMSPYTHIVRINGTLTRFWGHPRAIAELKKQVGR